MTKEYDAYLENTVNMLGLAEDAIDEMIEFCSYGEPEFYGSKAMKAFFYNLSCLCHNGKSFLYEMQEEIESRHKVKKK